MEIFWGVTASRSYVRTIPHDRSVMLSASGLWKPARQTWMRKRIWPWRRWMLDSGGYNMFMRYGDYPWTPETYLELVRAMNPPLAASMDYCCEPSVSERIEGMSVEDRVRATADMAMYLCKRDPRIFPVLQGWELPDYELSWRLTEPLRPRMVGIGSLCVRQRTNRIVHLCQELHWMLPAELWRHGFGVKIQALRHAVVREFFTSIDTDAWEFHRRAFKKVRHFDSDAAAGEESTWLARGTTASPGSRPPRAGGTAARRGGCAGTWPTTTSPTTT